MLGTQGKIALAVLIILHGVGLAGLNSSAFTEEFKSLVWINLLFIFAIVLSLHPKWNAKYFAFVPLVFVLGMAAEIVGVRTGQLFGEYNYTSLLGTKLMGVPLIIGLNWVILTYCAGMASSRIDPSIAVRVTIGALLMVGMDFLLEPFAIRYALWEWPGGHPPFRNYLGWFAVSLLVMTFFHKMIRAAYNPVASLTLLLLAVFFGLDWIINLI